MIFGTVEGIVHDPQHQPIAGANIRVKSANLKRYSDRTNKPGGSFRIAPLPVRDYIVTVQQPGFIKTEQHMTAASNTSLILDFKLTIARVERSTVVTTETPTANVDSVTPTTLVDQPTILHTPGASGTNNGTGRIRANLFTSPWPHSGREWFPGTTSTPS
jgi:hypothetical protein